MKKLINEFKEGERESRVDVIIYVIIIISTNIGIRMLVYTWYLELGTEKKEKAKKKVKGRFLRIV